MEIVIPIDVQAQGVVSPLTASRPLPLRNAGKVHFLLKGKLDLFLCQKTAEGDWGSRHPFLRIQESEAIFPVTASAGADALIAIGSPGSEILELSIEAFRTHLSEGAAWARKALDQWITDVAGKLFLSEAPLSYVDVTQKALVGPEATAQVIVAVEGVRWIKHLRGSSLPLRREMLGPIDGATGLFPVTKLLWVEATPDSEVKVFSLAEVEPAAALWAGLDAFHSIAARLLLSNREELEAQGRARIGERSAFNLKLFENALGKLQSSVSPAADVIVDSKCHNPVFLAMQMVAHELQMKLTAPIELLQGKAIRDPIQRIAKASGVRVRRVALKGDWWNNCDDPLLCFAENGKRSLAVLPRRFGRIDLHTAGEPGSVLLTPTLAAELDPMAYTLYRPFPRTAIGVGELLRFGLSRSKLELVLIVMLGMVSGLLAVVSPLAISVVFNRVIPGAERGQLLELAIILLVVTLASTMFTFVRGNLVLRMQGKIDATLQAALWDRLLALPVPFFRNFSSGDLAQRSMGIAQIRDILTGSVITAMLSGVFSFFSFGLLFYYNLKLALVATFLVAVAFGVSAATGLVQVGFRRKYLLQSGIISSRLLQFISGITKFKVSGTESRAFGLWVSDFTEQRRLSARARKLSIGLNVFNAVFPLVCMGTIFYCNARFGARPNVPLMTTGNFLGFLAAFTQFLNAALAISGTTADLASIVPIYERAKPILQTLPEVTDGKSNPGALSGRIEINSLRFSYGADSPLILRDISLKIDSGQSVAFVGSSGCGKSTLLRLLLGFERPITGAIYFDGQDLAGLDMQAVRRQVGVVLQSSKPVSGTILENIIGSAPLTVNDAWEACRLAGLEDDIKRMPMGLHTNISDGGGGISGGQRQRLMIARAIVAKPKILVFDEATSALDNKTQAIVNRSLTGLQATRIIIAHRLSTIQHVDTIFVLDQGRIVESGSYDQLIRSTGLFHDLAMRQLN